MAAPVRVEDEAFADVRVEMLGNLAGYNRFEALGRLTHLWRVCTHRGSYVVSEATVLAALGERGLDAIIGSELGERVEGGIRVRGTAGRIEWLEAKRRAAKAGGNATKRVAEQGRKAREAPTVRQRAVRVRPDGGQMAADTGPDGRPLTLTPTLTPTTQKPEVTAPPSEHSAIRLAWFAYWESKHGPGIKPTWDGKSAKQLSQLLSQHGEPEVRRRLAVLATSPPAWPAQPWDFGAFRQHFDKLVAPAARDTRVGRVEPKQPHEYPDGEVAL